MSHSVRKRCASAARPGTMLAAAGLAGALAACGGGVDLAGGQGPDPVVVDLAVAYVKRPLPDDAADLRNLMEFAEGADLWLRDRASPSAPERNITEVVTTGLGDVRDVSISADGERLLFALREPLLENVDDEDQPTWNIWEFDIPNAGLRRVITSDLTAEAGHDRAPAFLGDGRIVFTSTRQRRARAILLDEGKPQFAALDEDGREAAFVLHVMSADGGDIRQISFNQSHDLNPSVDMDGRIIFARWDNAGVRNEINLYRINPDGTGLGLLYGANSHATGSQGDIVQFVRPAELPNGGHAAIVTPFGGTDTGGAIVAIDTGAFVENLQALADNAGLSGPAQQPLTINDVTTEPGVSPGGRFSGVFPLWDGTDRFFVSWSDCRLLENGLIVPCATDRLADPGVVEADPLYGVWIYDPADDTQLPVVDPEEGIMFTDVVAAQPRDTPAVIFDQVDNGTADPVLVAEGVGILHVRSVFDIDGVDTTPAGIDVFADPALTLADARPARFIRLEKAVSQPDDNVRDIAGTAFGRSAAQGMREILGYAPVEPDGSVMIKVPADVAFAISVLDADGHRIGPRHQNWLQVRPGQTLQCSGCHDPSSGLSHGRPGAFDSVNSGALTTGVPFPNTNPAIFANFGESMAEARARISCNDDCAVLLPSVDVVYDDVWTDPVAAGRAPDASFALRYADLQTQVPTTPGCMTAWASGCRTVIHYPDHIHPLWSLDRRVFDVDGVTQLSDNTCASCHGAADAMGALQVPAAQLDLSDGPSTDEPDHLKAYRELMFPDNEQEIVMGAIQDRLVQTGTDPVTGDPVFSTVPVAAPLSVGGAAASTALFSRFNAGGSHSGFMTGAELRLLAEWLDIGGQYYNDPFAAPEN